MRRLFLVALPMLALAACQAPSQAPASRSVVFFTNDSAALDENAAGLVSEVAGRAKASPGAPIRVRGFTAPDGSAGFNRALAEARARNVADVLVAAGIERSRIRIEPRGPVSYEMIPTESRRVEILLGG
ncbi:OmpA family protein [Belnapia sp. T18]|uniref:OmpA family protein n=1 Tax=Belnapia arida TaxID=2804533 RepID=A0ABS1TY35_9PROT|nr:OmpA family protein [Belnapia arida]MBL6077337.1 OmpA family protein [Belnapia arida]